MQQPGALTLSRKPLSRAATKRLQRIERVTIPLQNIAMPHLRASPA